MRKKKIKNLVTTSIIDTWDKKKKNVLINHGCIPFSTIDKFSSYKYEIGKHPWDDRGKLENDYKYLKKLNTKIIKEYSKKFNDLHNSSFTKKYWTITFQPWCDIFIPAIYERWLNLNEYFKDIDSYSLKIIKVDKKKFRFESIDDFLLKIRTDLFNHFIYSKILRFNNIKLFKNINFKKKHETIYKTYKYRRNFFHKILNKIIISGNYFFLKKSKYFYIDTYIGRINELVLAIKLLAFGRPVINTNYKNLKYNENIRLKLKLRLKSENKFEKFLFPIIHEFIPKTFVENYQSINHHIEKLNWPDKPKVIFTSHAYRDEIPLFYIAKKKDMYNSKLYFGQHGGSFFHYKFNTGEDYQLKVSDEFISWGNFPKKNKIFNLGILKPLKKINYSSDNKSILIVLKSMSKFTNQINSSSGVNQHLKNLDSLNFFCNTLAHKIGEKNLLFRAHARHLGLDEEKIFKKNFPKSQHDNGTNNITDLIKKSKIVLYTYFSTGILESLALNYPSIVVNDFCNSKFKKSAMINVQGLIDAKILHLNYDTACKHLIAINGDVENWWNSDTVQSAIEKYCYNYAKINFNKLNNLYDKFIKDIKS